MQTRPSSAATSLAAPLSLVAVWATLLVVAAPAGAVEFGAPSNFAAGNSPRSVLGGSVVLVIVLMLAPFLILGGIYLARLRRRNSIVQNSAQVQGVILASTMTKDGRSASSGSIATSMSEPGHIGRGQTTQGAPTMKIRVRADLPHGEPFEYEEQIKVQRLDSVAVGTEVTVYYDEERPERATIAPDGYYEVNPGGYAFEPSPIVLDLRPVVATRSGADNTALLERLVNLRDAGALSEAEFEVQKRRLLGS